jgi:hypothetical protein
MTNQREREHFENTGVDGRIILRWLFRKLDVGIWAGSSRFKIERFGGQFSMR